MPRFAEFFAGGGMVSAALRPDWEVALANDIDPRKCSAYRQNWGDSNLVEGDIAQLDRKLLRQPIDLYWASSPCQDLSLAGRRRGLAGHRSGMFYAWIDLVQDSARHGFAPRLLAFENVSGLVSSNNGQDFRNVVKEFMSCGYKCGALEIDARYYLPQSRPRIFVIAVRNDIALTPDIQDASAQGVFHSKGLQNFWLSLPDELKSAWVWWRLNPPECSEKDLMNLVELDRYPTFSVDQTRAYLDMMDPRSLDRIETACKAGGLHVGTIYKRGRPDAKGHIRQRAEVRLDGLAGCLRTPGGGSSRQTLLFIRDGDIAMRLLQPREAVRLMGLPDSYMLPSSYNDAYRLAGDGVAVPVVRHLNEALFKPILALPFRRIAA